MAHPELISEKTAKSGDNAKSTARTLARGHLLRTLGKRPEKVKAGGTFPKKRKKRQSSRAMAFAGK